MGWLKKIGSVAKAIGRAVKWVATNEKAREAALIVAEQILAKKMAEAKRGK